ncbi:MAG: ATP-grasp domain-containing protein [Firmicutes bacterium]|nr:ATP-grasp domain-containing protein [Bacillota bacterium]
MFSKVNLIRVLKFLYYKLLCKLLHPSGPGLDPYRAAPVKRWFTSLLSRNNKAAVSLIVSGKHVGSGYRSWIGRKARINGVECWAIKRGKQAEILLLGDSPAIETVIRFAWRGPDKSIIENIKCWWFNKPTSYTKKADTGHTLWQQDTIAQFMHTLQYLSPLLEKPNRFDVSREVSDASEVRRAALARGLFVKRMGKLNYLMTPAKVEGVQKSQPSRVSTLIRSLSCHKHLTKLHLAKHNLPVPNGRVLTELDEAREYFRACRCPMVVKPLSGSHGRGITVNVETDDVLEIAWDYAKKFHDEVILEEFVKGVDVRVLVVGGKAQAALFRVPANVIGDGKHTIEALIEKKNKVRLLNPRMRKALIIPDSYTEEFLDRQGYSLRSVPKSGQIVFLHLKANIEAGGDSISLLGYIHPDLMSLAEEAAASFGTDDYWGIDLLVERIDLPRSQQNCKIVEVNSRANIFNVQFPMYGEPADVAQVLVDHLAGDTTDYPQQTVQVKVTGALTSEFFHWAERGFIELSLQGDIEKVGAHALINLHGPHNFLLQYIDNLMGWRDQKAWVDGVQILGNKAEKVMREAISKSKPSVSNVQKNHTDLDEWLFINEFESMGYEAEVLPENLIKLQKDGAIGITATRFSSKFCDKLCAYWYHGKKVLALNGIPVPRGVHFKWTEWSKAVRYLKQFPEHCVVSDLNPAGVRKEKITEENHLKAFWDRAQKTGTNYMLFEEDLIGDEVAITVVAGKAVSALAIKPVSITGDGEKTVAQLIADKNVARSSNPFYRSKLLSLEDREINRMLKLAEVNPADVPSPGQMVYLEDRVKLHLGGETENVTNSLHSDFFFFAVQAVQAIPGLKAATVHMIVSQPCEPAVEQRWVVIQVNTSPSIAMFHYPWQGEGYNLVGQIVNDLCLKEQIKWIEESVNLSPGDQSLACNNDLKASNQEELGEGGLE